MPPIVMRTQIERWLNRLWYSGATPGVALRGLSRLYGAVVARSGHHNPIPPPIPVIVVGNLVAGGSGKTPVVALVCRAMSEHGLRVGLISRGHGRTRRVKEPFLVEADAGPELVGDEALWLSRATHCPCWVGRDRAACLQAAIAAGMNVVISDDGLQNRTLPRSYELCVIDGLRGFGNGHLLPAGPLREPVARLARCDAVWVKNGAFVPPVAHERFQMDAQSLTHLVTGHRLTLSSLSEQSVIALCGIGNPDSFTQSLKALGAHPIARVFNDHHSFSSGDFEGLPPERMIIVTEKDAVKLEGLELDDDIKRRLFILAVEVAIKPQALSALVSHVREYCP